MPIDWEKSVRSSARSGSSRASCRLERMSQVRSKPPIWPTVHWRSVRCRAAQPDLRQQRGAGGLALRDRPSPRCRWVNFSPRVGSRRVRSVVIAPIRPSACAWSCPCASRICRRTACWSSTWRRAGVATGDLASPARGPSHPASAVTGRDGLGQAKLVGLAAHILPSNRRIARSPTAPIR